MHKRRLAMIGKICGFAFAALILAMPAGACLRATADKRAIQWSDAIVHARLEKIVDARDEVYEFTVTDSIDGPLKPADQIQAHHVTLPATPDCGGHLTADDIGKNYRLLLRGKPSATFIIVNIAISDPTDTDGNDAFQQLVQETRKADSDLTDDQIKIQALAYANAQDDTEAEQAQDALEQMGPKAIPAIRAAMSGVNDIGKQRLDAVLKDITPPQTATTP